MKCRRCASRLERPGDYCRVCDTPNADVVAVEVGRARATVHVAYDGEVVGERVVTTVPHDEERKRTVEMRNFAGLIADEVRRKHPDEVYARGDDSVIRELRSQLRYEIRRMETVESVLGGDDERLATVDTPAKDKIGGRHSTLIGEKNGYEALKRVAQHPNVKKIVPGPINASGRSQGGFGAKVTRADGNGNLRLLLRDGSSVQENRIVTTAMDRETGEGVREELNERLRST